MSSSICQDIDFIRYLYTHYLLYLFTEDKIQRRDFGLRKSCDRQFELSVCSSWYCVFIVTWYLQHSQDFTHSACLILVYLMPHCKIMDWLKPGFFLRVFGFKLWTFVWYCNV